MLLRPVGISLGTLFSQETSCGQFAFECVSTTAKIMANAEGTLDHGGNFSFMRNFTPKPMPTIEVGVAALPIAAEKVNII